MLNILFYESNYFAVNVTELVYVSDLKSDGSKP